ncbi:MAG TPA: VOC family protein [Luteibacter sp.]|jgi:uncharacterized glyoxalase superfamily protein PhnB|nr:VOC family protein [Luteibacter sp.]
MKVTREPTNRSMPPGTIIPELAYADVRVATLWLCRAFGFVERLRIGDHRAQLSFGEGSVVIMRTHTARDAPLDAAGFGHAVMVRLDDVDTHCERARQHGARIVQAPADFPYGERQYSAVDIGGHAWTFSQTIADVDPTSWGGTVPR